MQCSICNACKLYLSIHHYTACKFNLLIPMQCSICNACKLYLSIYHYTACKLNWLIPCMHAIFTC